MRLGVAALMVVMAGALLIGPLLAQQASQPATASGGSGQQSAGMPAQQGEKRYVMSQNLIGSTVKDQQGQNAGKVEGIVLDTQNGSITYVVLSSGGQLNIGENLVAVPWQKFQVSQDQTLMVKASKANVEKAPGFAKNQAPNFEDQSYNEKIYGWWQVPYGAPSTPAAASKGQTMEQQAQASSGRTVGLGTEPTKMKKQ